MDTVLSDCHNRNGPKPLIHIMSQYRICMFQSLLEILGLASTIEWTYRVLERIVKYLLRIKREDVLDWIQSIGVVWETKERLMKY